MFIRIVGVKTVSNFSFFEMKLEYTLLVPSCVGIKKIYTSAPVMSSVGRRMI